MCMYVFFGIKTILIEFQIDTINPNGNHCAKQSKNIQTYSKNINKKSFLLLKKFNHKQYFKAN